MPRVPYLIAALYLATAAAPAEARTYTVRKGDYKGLGGIAERVRVPVPEILVCNPDVTRKTPLVPGRQLKVAEEYTTKEGDTLWNIARKYGVTVAEIIGYNNIKDADAIKPGTLLEFPCRKPAERKLEQLVDDDEPEPRRPAPKPRKPTRRRTMRFPSGLELEVVNDAQLTGHEREFYDPNNSGNPLLRVPREKLYHKVGKHFVLAEFAHIPNPSLAQPEHVQRRDGDAYSKYIRLSPALVRRLDQIRERSRQSVEVNSGYRSWGYNTRLYRQVYHRRPTTRSRHMSGDGADLAIASKRMRKAIERAFANGGIGRGGSFIHGDMWRQRRWHY